MEADLLSRLWSDNEPAVEEHATFPPRGLDSSVWSQVAAGKVARPKVETGAMGVGLLGVSRAEAWLAITDDHPIDAVKGLTQVALAGAWASEKWLYQRIDLPWPIQDRHWVLHSTNNVALAQVSGAWERAWDAAPDWLERARPSAGEGFAEAVTVPTNRGSWLLVEVDEGHTLGIYRAQADLGGAVPEGAAEAYTASTLDALFRSTERNARSMRGRYGPGCAPQPGGDGAPLPCFAAR